MQAFKQGLMIVLLAGLVGTVAVLGKPTSGDTGAPLGNEEALNRYGFYLREVSHECGINFTHQVPTLDPKLEPIMPIIASMGASVTVVDFDHDGWPDLYVVNSGEGSKNALYHNERNGTFKDVAEEMSIADLNKPGTGVCMGAVWGDYDNDGYDDLLIYKWGKPELYHNDHGKGFTRVTEKAGLPKWVNANSAIWLDYDGDGKLDLLICGYWREDIDLWHLDTTKIMPNDFEYATNGGRKYLLRNRGDGTFEDVTEKVGLTSRSWTLAVAAAHLCGSRYPDIFLANDYGVSELYANQDGKKFVELGKQSGIRAPKSGMNVSFGDIYNQGCFSAYISNITEPGQLIQGNNLWVMEKPNAGSDIHFMNEANSLGVEQGGWSWGAQFGDLNNDGQLDLYLTNGYISTDNPESYWFDYSQIAGAFKGIIEDAKNWPAMKGRQLSGHQQKHVWVNRGGKFIEVAQAVGVTDTYDGRSVALVDLFNRGVLDVIVANQKGPLLVYRNTVKPGREWIQFQLEGTRSNRSAIGAQVHLYWNSQQQLQEVSGGDGYASQNMRRLHFGLGENPHLEKAVIQWPSGQEQTLTDLKPGQIYRVKEPK